MTDARFPTNVSNIVHRDENWRLRIRNEHNAAKEWKSKQQNAPPLFMRAQHDLCLLRICWPNLFFVCRYFLWYNSFPNFYKDNWGFLNVGNSLALRFDDNTDLEKYSQFKSKIGPCNKFLRTRYQSRRFVKSLTFCVCCRSSSLQGQLLFCCIFFRRLATAAPSRSMGPREMSMPGSRPFTTPVQTRRMPSMKEQNTRSRRLIEAHQKKTEREAEDEDTDTPPLFLSTYQVCLRNQGAASRGSPCFLFAGFKYAAAVHADNRQVLLDPGR